MSEWFEPVEQVDSVVVLGEKHRDRSSRDLAKEVWKNHNFGATCVETHPGDITGWRNDRGGAIGWVLEKSQSQNIPRYYVDTPSDDIIEGFGGKREAYNYLKNLENRYSTKDKGKVNREDIYEVRDEIRDEYGEEAYRLIFEKREKKMTQRAKWVADQQDDKVLIVVGSAHTESIVEYLKTDIEPIEVNNRRKRDGERIEGGPWSVMTTIAFKGIWKLISQRFD